MTTSWHRVLAMFAAVTLAAAGIVAWAIWSPRSPPARMYCRWSVRPVGPEAEQLVSDFKRTYELARATPRLALAGPIATLNDVQARLERLEVPECYLTDVWWAPGALSRVKSYMAGKTKALESFLSGEMSAEYVAALEVGYEEADAARLGEMLSLLKGIVPPPGAFEPPPPDEQAAKWLQLAEAAAAEGRCHDALELFLHPTYAFLKTTEAMKAETDRTAAAIDDCRRGVRGGREPRRTR